MVNYAVWIVQCLTNFEDACCACYRVCILNYLFNVTAIKI